MITPEIFLIIYFVIVLSLPLLLMAAMAVTLVSIIETVWQ